MSRRVAYLLFQSHRKGSYLHDGDISVSSGQLKAAGIENDIFEAVFDERDDQENERLLEELAGRLTTGGYGLAVVSRIWAPDVIWGLRRHLETIGGSIPQLVFMPRKSSGEDVGPYDFVNPGSTPSVIEALARAPEPIDPTRIPGLMFRNELGQMVSSEAGECPSEGEPDRYKLRPNFRRIRLNEDVLTDHTTLVVYGNPGCPFRKTFDHVPGWTDVKLDPTITNTKGCSFCNINLAEDYAFIHDIARHAVEQIQNIQDTVPDAELVILLDQDPFPYLPDLFSRLNAAGSPRVHLLIQARADLFLLREEAFEKALELARQGGHGCTPFLIGIENFHQPTLDFYNKGVTVEMNIRVLAYLRGVADRYADVYDSNHVSPGFILWHPWVTFESLRTNVEAIEEHGLHEFRSEVALSKIRLYPDIPFYWKAKQDGLMLEDYSGDGFDSASRYGYPEESPYRFHHREAQVAYTLLASLCHTYEPIEELKLLACILDWVESQSASLEALDQLAMTNPERLVKQFEDEHAATIASLRKENTPTSRVRELDTSTREHVQGLLAPLWPGNGPGPEGFELARVIGDENRVQLFFTNPAEVARVRQNPVAALFRILLEPRSSAPHFRQSSRWNVSYSSTVESRAVRDAIDRISARIVARDPGIA